MTTKTMTITRALSTLKQIESEIKGYFDKPRILIASTIGLDNNKRSSISGYTVETLTQRIQSDVDGLEGLMTRQFKIKSKIIESNSKTNITVGGKTMTVAEAIFLKSTIEQRKSNITKIQTLITSARTQYEKYRKDFDNGLNEISKNNKGVDFDVEQITKLREAEMSVFKSLNTPEIYDPLKVNDFVEKELKFINDVVTELDYTLSTSNVQTTIEVED